MSEKVKKPLPIGLSDFDEVITKNYYYIDKSLFIKELLENRAKAILIPRPRRFGKTLNMSMLKCFFEKNTDSKRHLFNGLKIADYPEIMAEQGQYPVIFLTFKGVDGDIWEDSLRKLKDLIANEYRRHSYLLASSILDATQQKNFRAIISGDAEKTTYEASLQCLTEYLEAFHKKNVIVLIDEYDAPIHAGYRHKYYDNVTLFIKNFLSGGLKDNSKLQFGVVTGIMRIAKESIFSGLNNLEVHAIPASFFADKFGLLEPEVIELLQAYDLLQNLDAIRNWYNGYKSSEFMLYNPWSIMNSVKQHGKLEAYWINASNNDVIKKLMTSGGTKVKKNIETLMSGNTLHKPMRENLIYPDLGKKDATLWNFLFAGGYLTYRTKTGRSIDLSIPNKEILCFFEETVLSWFDESEFEYNDMIDSLLAGDIATFKKLFADFVRASFSSFDVGKNTSENFYHAFVLGMLAKLADHYEIRSNRESGYGRYDVMVIPKDSTKFGLVIEFKKIDTDEKETLEKAVVSALQQIEDKAYETELRARGITEIRKIAIAFDGKKVLVDWNRHA